MAPSKVTQMQQSAKFFVYDTSPATLKFVVDEFCALFPKQSLEFCQCDTHMVVKVREDAFDESKQIDMYRLGRLSGHRWRLKVKKEYSDVPIN